MARIVTVKKENRQLECTMRDNIFDYYHVINSIFIYGGKGLRNWSVPVVYGKYR